MTDLLAAQQRAWANKLGQGFNSTDVAFEFGLLLAELGEAFTAWRHGHDVGEELADIAIFTMGLAQMLGIDLDAEVQTKLAINEARVYRPTPNGVLVKDGPGAPPGQRDADPGPAGGVSDG